MPPPQATYLARTSNTGYDPATLSDDEDDATNTDAASVSSSTWSAAAAAAVTTLAVLDGPIPVTENATELRDWKISRVGGEPVRPTAALPAAAAFSPPLPSPRQRHCSLFAATFDDDICSSSHSWSPWNNRADDPFSHILFSHTAQSSAHQCSCCQLDPPSSSPSPSRRRLQSSLACA